MTRLRCVPHKNDDSPSITRHHNVVSMLAGTLYENAHRFTTPTSDAPKAKQETTVASSANPQYKNPPGPPLAPFAPPLAFIRHNLLRARPQVRHALPSGNLPQSRQVRVARAAVERDERGRLHRQHRRGPVPHHPPQRREEQKAVAPLDIAVQLQLFFLLQKRAC